MSVSAHRWAKGSSWRVSNWQQNTNSFIQVSSTKDTHFKDDHFLHKGLSLNSNLVGCNSNYDESFTKFVYQFYLSLLYQGLQLPGPLQQCKAITTHLADKQSCEDALLLTCASPDFQLLLPYSNWKFSVQCHHSWCLIFSINLFYTMRYSESTWPSASIFLTSEL